MNEPEGNSGPEGDRRAASAAQAALRSSAATGPETIGSETLLRGHNEILIRHGAELYRLRSTSKGKLILTK